MCFGRTCREVERQNVDGKTKCCILRTSPYFAQLQNQEVDGRNLNFHSHRIARIFCESKHESTLRTIPSFFIRKYKVERFNPNRDAAPLGPERTHRVSFRVIRIWLRSTSSRVLWRSAL